MFGALRLGTKSPPPNRKSASPDSLSGVGRTRSGLESHRFEIDQVTADEPGIPRGETPASTDARHMEIRVWTEWKDPSVRREPAGCQGQRPVLPQPGPTAQVSGFTEIRGLKARSTDGSGLQPSADFGATLPGPSAQAGMGWLDIIFEVPAATHVFDRYNLLIDNIVVKNSVSNVPDAGSTGWLLSGALGVFGLWQQRLRRP